MKFLNYFIGELPIVIVAAHNGLIRSLKLPKRSLLGSILENDVRTRNIAYNVSKYLQSNLKLRPYMIINNIHRKFLDLNRDIMVGGEQFTTRHLWLQFHQKLDFLIKHAINKFGFCILFDIHGNQKTTKMIQLGYGTRMKDLDNKNTKNNTLKYISKFHNTLDIIIGKKSLGNYIKELETTPSPSLSNSTLIKNVKERFYYNGGYIIRTYSKKYSIDCIQIEISKDLRSVQNIEYTSKILGNAIIDFFFHNYYPILNKNKLFL